MHKHLCFPMKMTQTAFLGLMKAAIVDFKVGGNFYVEFLSTVIDSRGVADARPLIVYVTAVLEENRLMIDIAMAHSSGLEISQEKREEFMRMEGVVNALKVGLSKEAVADAFRDMGAGEKTLKTVLSIDPKKNSANRITALLTVLMTRGLKVDADCEAQLLDLYPEPKAIVELAIAMSAQKFRDQHQKSGSQSVPAADPKD
jgi:hypothetical protein